MSSNYEKVQNKMYFLLQEEKTYQLKLQKAQEVVKQHTDQENEQVGTCVSLLRVVDGKRERGSNALMFP